jgi:hypothetical protein
MGTSIVRATWITWGLLGIVAVPPAMFSVMMFDAPGAAENWATIVLAAATLSFPFVCLISVIESRNRLLRDLQANAYWWACLPLVNVVVGGVGLAWISLVQGGKFSG